MDLHCDNCDLLPQFRSRHGVALPDGRRLVIRNGSTVGIGRNRWAVITRSAEDIDSQGVMTAFPSLALGRPVRPRHTPDAHQLSGGAPRPYRQDRRLEDPI